MDNRKRPKPIIGNKRPPVNRPENRIQFQTNAEKTKSKPSNTVNQTKNVNNSYQKSKNLDNYTSQPSNQAIQTVSKLSSNKYCPFPA